MRLSRAHLFLALLASCAESPPATPARDCRATELAAFVLRPIRSVTPLYGRQTGKAGESHRLLGAAIVIEPEQGTSKELLQRRLDCCAVDAASPLGVVGARATVTSGEGAYHVAITSEDDDGASEIVRRARALVR